jgi:hypothetical protein
MMQSLNSFGVRDEKSLGFGILATALAGCLQSQPNQAPVPEPAVECTKVDLKKLLDQFDIFGAVDWFSSNRAANKDQ